MLPMEIYKPEIGYIVFLLCRQEDRDAESGLSLPDMPEKLARLSTDDTSLTDWHLGFHISLVLLSLYFAIFVLFTILK